jgi:hypothetical protein
MKEYMDTFGFVIIFGASAFMIVFGILSTKHFFDVNKTNEDSYFETHPWRY